MASRSSSNFDYIVIGSGIGGSVVAGRLSEDPSVRVLLLEAGPLDDDADIHATELTSLFAVWSKPQFDWGLSTVEEPGLGGRKMPIIQGRVAGGGSSLHGRIFIRGHRRDFDHWNYMGNEGWSFDQVLPYFKKLEDYMGPASDYRGVGGPMPVMELPKERRSVAAQTFVAGARELGFEGDWDFNGAKQEGGAGYIQTTTTRDFKRASAYSRSRSLPTSAGARTSPWSSARSRPGCSSRASARSASSTSRTTSWCRLAPPPRWSSAWVRSIPRSC